MGNKAIAEAIGRTPDSVKDKMARLGISRTEEEVKNLRRKNNAGQFKKGNLPHNTKYNGHERITKDGYIEVRLRKGKYRLKHLVVWEKENGPLPEGYCLTFLDENKLNCKLSNLKMITRIENMLRNSKHDYPSEIITSMTTLCLINNKLNTLQNGTK